MATCYFLDCKTHNEAVHIADNKLNPANNEELAKMFLIYHGYHSQCHVVLESEHTIEWAHVKKFKSTQAKIEEKISKRMTF